MNPGQSRVMQGKMNLHCNMKWGTMNPLHPTVALRAPRLLRACVLFGHRRLGRRHGSLRSSTSRPTRQMMTCGSASMVVGWWGFIGRWEAGCSTRSIAAVRSESKTWRPEGSLSSGGQGLEAGNELCRRISGSMAKFRRSLPWRVNGEDGLSFALQKVLKTGEAPLVCPAYNLIRWCGRLTTSGRGTCRGSLEGFQEVEEEPRSMPLDEVQQLLHRWGLDRSLVKLALWEAGLWLVATVAHLRPHLRHHRRLRLWDQLVLWRDPRALQRAGGLQGALWDALFSPQGLRSLVHQPLWIGGMMGQHWVSARESLSGKPHLGPCRHHFLPTFTLDVLERIQQAAEPDICDQTALTSAMWCSGTSSMELLWKGELMRTSTTRRQWNPRRRPVMAATRWWLINMLMFRAQRTSQLTCESRALALNPSEDWANFALGLPPKCC